MSFHRKVLQLDAEQETKRITEWLRQQVLETLKKRGGVVGVSGGIDSAVVLALGVRALGANRVVPVLLPERESSPNSILFARKLCQQLGIETVVEDVTGPLLGFDCYRRRDEAVRRLFPNTIAPTSSKSRCRQTCSRKRRSTSSVQPSSARKASSKRVDCVQTNCVRS